MPSPPSHKTTAPLLLTNLASHQKRLRQTSLASLYDSNPLRAETFSIRLDNLLFDFSRNLIDTKSLDSLLTLARTSNIEAKRDAMFHGALVNQSEQRAALHTALRSQSQEPLLSAWGQDERPTFLLSRKACQTFAKAWQAGKIRNKQGEPLTDLIHVGIGGSDLGTRLLVEALQALPPRQRKTTTQQQARLFFVSGFGALEDLLSQARPRLDPKRCLVFVVSKSFRTEETLLNAQALMHWMRPAVGDSLWRHFVAVTAAPAAVGEALPSLSLPSERIFLLPASVGGRYSVWSAVSLSAELLLGTKMFEQFLKGAEAADRHFLEQPLEKNIPVVMGLLSVWYRNFWNFSNHAVFPYDQRLRSVPSFLQQLAMESGGKVMRADGDNFSENFGSNCLGKFSSRTASLLWGGHGSAVQHSVFQWLHQGTESFSCDFWLEARGHKRGDKRGDARGDARLVAHCLAQMEVLMRGREGIEEKGEGGVDGGDRISRRDWIGGGHPCSLLMYSDFSEFVLGMLLALYEHRVFVEGILWGTNPFDQWGVEGGKAVAGGLLKVLEGDSGGDDEMETGSLRDAVGFWREMRK